MPIRLSLADWSGIVARFLDVEHYDVTLRLEKIHRRGGNVIVLVEHLAIPARVKAALHLDDKATFRLPVLLLGAERACRTQLPILGLVRPSPPHVHEDGTAV